LIGKAVLVAWFWWATAVNQLRELGCTLLRLAILRYGVIAASSGGKLETLIQIVAIGLYILPLATLPIPADVMTWGRGVLMGVAIALTVATGVDSLARAAALVRRGRRAAGAT